jgi:hypothetical protein
MSESIFLKRTRRDERAQFAESAKLSERAQFLECTKLGERVPKRRAYQFRRASHATQSEPYTKSESR